MSRIYAPFGYLAIVLAFFCVCLLVHRVGDEQYGQAREHFIETSRSKASAVGDKVSDNLQLIYQNIRTLAMLPGVQNIDRHGMNLSEDGWKTFQQIYRNLASNVKVSEVYVVPVDFDPEKLDPLTGQREVPILMFDELISHGSVPRDFANHSSPLTNTATKASSDDEVHEYRQLKEQVGFLKRHYPDISHVQDLDFPMINGPEVLTCDFTLARVSGNGRDRSGLMFSVPFFGPDGRFKGSITAIMLTAVIRNLIPDENYALVNPANSLVIESTSGGQEKQSADVVIKAEPDKNLLFSGTFPLKVGSQAPTWSLWAGLPNSEFENSPEYRAIVASQQGLYWVLVVLTCATLAWWWLILRNMLSAEQVRLDLEERVTARTSEISLIAYHDHLTGLANRRYLMDFLGESIKAKSAGTDFALLYIDLDMFKHVNDTFGHLIGDQLLKCVANTLKTCLGNDDFPARIGGDEFVVFCTGNNAEAHAEDLAERIIELARPPININGHRIEIGVSIGISVVSDQDETPEMLLKKADLALYKAKTDGKGVWRKFEPAMELKLIARHQLEDGLRMALEREEFVVHYQMQVDAVSGHTTGFEALVRWDHPELGLKYPGYFIEAVEDMGLIVPIGEWILNQACRDAALWSDDVTVAVNLSALQFRSQGLLDVVDQALKSSGLPARRLELEITESVLLDDVEETRRIMTGLRQLGVRIALDDFGTGYSSLGYLRSFPFNKIKIDRSFVVDMEHSPESRIIVHSIVDLATKLGMTTTAEGIETAQQLGFVTQCGVTTLQGFYFSPGVSFAHVSDLLALKAA